MFILATLAVIVVIGALFIGNIRQNKRDAIVLPDAAQSDFYVLELVSAGVMRGLMARKCDMYFTIDKKIALFLRCAMKIYDVPAQECEAVISRVRTMNLAAIARDTLENTARLAQAGFDENTLWASAAEEREENAL